MELAPQVPDQSEAQETEVEAPLSEEEALGFALSVVHRVPVSQAKIVIDAVSGTSGKLVIEMLEVLISAAETRRIGGTERDNPYPDSDIRHEAWNQMFRKTSLHGDLSLVKSKRGKPVTPTQH